MYKLDEQLKSQSPKNSEFYLVAIDGRGASGKTTLAEYVQKLLPDFVLLNGDDYFEPATDQVAWGYFNEKRFTDDVVIPLKTGNHLTYRPYSWHTEPHISEKPVTVHKGLVIERCYSFILDLNWDLKIWVETPRQICFERGTKRNHMPKEKEVKAWNVWQVAEDDYITEQHPKAVADIVLNGMKPFTGQFV